MFVRTASERDLEAIKVLLAETWHATYGVERVKEITAEWHSVASLKARLTLPNSEFLVADDGKAIAGMAFAASTDDPKVVMLRQLYVRPGNQRAGIGRMLLEEIEQCFPEAHKLRLEAEEANGQAIAFYLANGFRQTGRTEDPARPELSAALFEKELG
ncbi:MULTISPECIES: GNAT family N-acetyltransferase [Hyphomicrobiales]|jgi:ribosomal protein S18 acetylase RimI-like enzyme|uniref:GNAT family N-acetyltransferase n=1 Tax=Hyphomicrobiales TaxID=356 RepID=UPI000372ED77|nr:MULTISPECIES: GNAT family N-acetyltransferase [Phyllobacteriaceae]MCX8568176.1 GNAT family N-acetyltransferase [Aminobacter sp. MET-1]